MAHYGHGCGFCYKPINAFLGCIYWGWLPRALKTPPQAPNQLQVKSHLAYQNHLDPDPTDRSPCSGKLQNDSEYATSQHHESDDFSIGHDFPPGRSRFIIIWLGGSKWKKPARGKEPRLQDCWVDLGLLNGQKRGDSVYWGEQTVSSVIGSTCIPSKGNWNKLDVAVPAATRQPRTTLETWTRSSKQSKGFQCSAVWRTRAQQV